MFTLLLFTAATIVTVAVCQGTQADDQFCPNDRFRYQNYCYKNYTNEVEYWEARSRCQALGADLTTMADEQETEALARMFPSIPGKVDLWIGLYRQTGKVKGGRPDGFRWTDGTPFNSSYDNWFDPGTGSKEPNYEDQYARFYRKNGTSPVKWAAAGKKEKKGYICKKVMWDPRKQHCYQGNCYRISAGKFNSSTAARQACEVRNMTVLQYGHFPRPLNSTFSVQAMPDDHFWLEHDNKTECRSISTANECPANPAARVMCTGPADVQCPCGWIGFDDHCYYFGTQNATQQCELMNANLTEITSHTENLFIKSIAKGSRSYWIKNDGNSVYCGSNRDTCWDMTIIDGNGEWQQNFSSHSIICKKKKSDLKSGINFCADGYPGECYNSSQTKLSSSNLANAKCGSNRTILNETMLDNRNLSFSLAKAINSPDVSCSSYWINRANPKLIANNNTNITRLNITTSEANGTTVAPYICVTENDECASSPCKNGTCVDMFRDFTCNCAAGFTGKTCETDIDECHSNPCQHGSSCVDRVNSYICNCAKGYSGSNCELGILCTSGWISYENYCYMYNTTLVPYWDARRQCQALGADLTTMVNAQETKALKSISGKVDLWIGLYRQSDKLGDNGAFKWTDGTGFDLSQTNWFRKEPGTEDQYVRFYRSHGTAPVKWAAAGATENSKPAVRGYICKKETWKTSMQHCFDGKCYRISSTGFDKDGDATAECVKYNMTVLQYGTFPDALNTTFGVSNIPEDYFWTEYGNITKRRPIHNGPWNSTNTAARVICTGPAEERCPCGWHEYDEFCYYVGPQSEKKNKPDARAHCESMDAKLARVSLHTENLFIQSLLNSSQTYWIKNRRNAPYCWHSQDECENDSVIFGNGTWIGSDSSEQHHVLCKKKKEKDRKPPVDFCIVDHPRECYNFSQTHVALRDLGTVNCGQDTKILNEEMLQERIKYLSSNLAKAINSPNVTCASYGLDSKGMQIISIKNDTIDVSSQVDSSALVGYICVQDIDECASSPCMNGGKCADALHNYSCICVAGYTGEQCETDVDECASSPCFHNSTCIDQLNGYICNCSGGYNGTHCETDIEECASHPCQHGSTCDDRVNGYVCNCKLGYTGINCETDKDECASNPCQHHSTCTDKVNSYICNCAQGYRGNNCETDIDECASDPCQHGSACDDGVNSYVCNCKLGYTGVNCETALPSKAVPAAVGSVVGLAIIAFIVLLVLYFRRKGKLLTEGIPMVERGTGVRESQVGEPRRILPSKVNPAACVLSVKKLKENGQNIIAESNKERLVAEFESIPKENDFDMSVGKDPANKPRNRFKNIIPYDHNRVILDRDDETQSNYINASFINTSRKNKEFLATQGPKPETLADFWSMIWQENVTVIVMLTNLIEGARRKCEQYWPDGRTEQTYGDITAKTTKEQILPSYTLRRIKAWKNEEVHTITHYHFRVWPDHGVPHTAMALLNFHNKAKADMTASKGPVLVHCSAGVGRTGTFIGLDLLLDEAEQNKKISIYNCVVDLRKDRPHMVQNKDQYIFLYKAMVQWATLGQTIIPCYEYESTYASFKTSVGKQHSQIDLQFKCLKDISVEYSTDEMQLALSESNTTKNRNVNILPKFSNRVLLTTLTSGMNDYINAIFLDGYQKLNSFIATQAPLPETKMEFWSMVQDYHCSAIVMLLPLDMLGKDEVYVPDSKGDELVFDQTTVEKLESYQEGSIIMNDLSLSRMGKTSKIRHFSLAEKLDIDNAPDIFCALHSLVDRWQQQVGQEKVVVHCIDGAQWTGVFCASICLFDQVNIDQEVDVFEMVQKLKTCRPNFFTSQRQYEQLYDIIQHYLRQFQTYANFQ